MSDAKVIRYDKAIVSLRAIHGEARTFRLEQLVFGIADECLIGYNGGVWSACSINGSISLLPPQKEKDKYELVCKGLGSNVTTDRISAGVAITLAALNHLCWNEFHSGRKDSSAMFSREFYSLRDIAYQNNSKLDSTSICSFLD